MKFGYEGHTIEGDLDDIIFNPVASTIKKLTNVQTSDIDAKLALVNAGP
jgi:hypothetical protein